MAGITTEWWEREGDVAESAILHTRYTDTVIVGQGEPAMHAVRPAHGLPERVCSWGSVAPRIEEERVAAERIIRLPCHSTPPVRSRIAWHLLLIAASVVGAMHREFAIVSVSRGTGAMRGS